MGLLASGAIPVANPAPAFDVLRTARAALLVRDLAESKRFYVDLLGFVVTEETESSLLLRGVEERTHHSLELRLADAPAVERLGFRVRAREDLERADRYYRERGRPVRRTALPDGHPALLCEDANGFPLELFADVSGAECMLQRFDLHRGARPTRIDHFNLMVPDVERALPSFLDLGFRLSELIATDPPDERIVGAWTFRKPDVHDVSFTTSQGPRLHHIGYWVPDALSILHACDGLAAGGYAESIERGPGRHGVSNAYFVYLRDPDGHRIELTTPDYYTGDPDLEPIRWSASDPRRRTFWGHHIPESWFAEGSTVLDLDGHPVPLEEPVVLEQAAPVG